MMEGFETNTKKRGRIDLKLDVLLRNIEFLFSSFVTTVVKILVKVFKY